MSSLLIGRLLIGPPLQWFEPLGDPVQGLGGAVVSAPRTPPQYQPTIATFAPDGTSDTLADRLRIRRQLRSLLNNTPLKLGGFIYVVYSDDLEQNGWFVPDQASLQDITSPSGLATGAWQVASATWDLAGRQRTHREARSALLKDLRTGLYHRDQLEWIYSTDFSALAAIPLTILPPGATSASDSVTGAVVSGAALPTGRDGGICQVVEGLTDGTVLAYQRPESSLNLGDVIVYDRRGQITAPTTGPGTSWEEAYGPDHAWNWLTAAQPNDAPVLDNGLVRIRYDASTGDPGFRVDVWTGAAYVEQGKVTFERVGDSTGFCNTWVSAGMVEWTPERAVIEVVLANSADANSREHVFVTVQRGQVGATFECYPAPKAAGTSADVKIFYTMDGPDSNDSVMFEPATSTPASAHDNIWSSASSNWTSASGTFSASTANFLSILRCQGGASTVGAYQVCLAVLQKSTTFAGVSDASAYGGSAQNAVAVSGAGGMGYLQAKVSYVATQSDQVKGSGSFTSTQASQYRVFGLVTTTWTDFGEYTGTAVTTGSSTRVESHLTQDRTRAGALWNGCRDAGQAVLLQSRQNGAIVAR